MATVSRNRKFYQVAFTNGGKSFSHLWHTLKRAESDMAEMRSAGITDIQIYVYDATLTGFKTAAMSEVAPIDGITA